MSTAIAAAICRAGLVSWLAARVANRRGRPSGVGFLCGLGGL